MNTIFYVYDTRTQFEKPIVTIFDERDVETVCTALFGPANVRPQYIMVTTYRLHASYNKGAPKKQRSRRRGK